MKTRIQQIRARLEAAPDMPNKEFPMWLGIEGNPEQTEMLNSYLQLGFHAKQDIADLLAVVEVFEAVLSKLDGRWAKGHYEGDLVNEALTKAQAILDKGEANGI